MPELGEAMVEGTITRWLRSVGDEITVGEPLFEVSTDKVDSEVPAPVSGVILNIVVNEGETVPVGAVLAMVGASAERVASAGATTPAGSPGEQAASDPRAVAGAASEERRQKSRGLASGRPLLSPSVTQLLDAHGLAADGVAPTGGRGRLTTADVLRAAGEMVSRPRTFDPNQTPARTDNDRQIVTSTTVQRPAAEHVVRSSVVSTYTCVAVDVDFQNVEWARNASGSSFDEREEFAFTLVPFVATGIAAALRDSPSLNASVAEGELVVHPTVNLRIAVDHDSLGLVVVTVRSAELKRLRALAREIDELARHVSSRGGGEAGDTSGSTFTITNVGSLGVMSAMPIIKQPEVASLAMGAVTRRPVVVIQPDGSEAIAIRPVGSLTLTWDHQAVDADYASAFIVAVKRILESRDWTAELA